MLSVEPIGIASPNIFALNSKKKKAKTVSTVSERSKTKFSVSPEQKQKLLLNSKYPGFLSNTFSAHYL